MRIPQSGLRIDSPAWPLVQTEISYWGIASAAGNVLGTTIVCGNLVNEPTYAGLSVKVLDGDASGQVRTIALHPAGTDTLTVPNAFTDNAGAVVQIVAGTRFVILSTAGGGGAPGPVIAPSVGLWMLGECDPGMAASQNTVVCPNLAGLPNDVFNDEFWMQVIHNFDAPGTVPEREIRRITNWVGGTATFTVDPFTANVEANDLVAIFHESIMGIEILGFGTLTLSSATVPEDNLRPEVNNYFRGCLLMTTEGAVRFQPRRILESTIGTGIAGTGIFTLDPNNPFTGVPGLVDYIIIGDQTEFVPTADAVNNRTPSDVIGAKDDTAQFTIDDLSSLIRYMKAVHNVKIEATGAADAGSDTNTLVDAARAEAIDYWNGMTLLMLTGNNAGLARRIYDYAVGSIEVRDAFPNAIVATDIYIITSDYEALLAAVDSAENFLLRDVIGGKTDTGITIPDNVSSIIRYLKGILNAANEVPIWATPTTGSHTTTGVTEETILETAFTDPFRLWMYIDLVNMIGGDDFTFRVHVRVDGTTYRLKSEQQLVGAQTLDVYEIEGLYGDTACDIRVTVQRASGVDRIFPFRHNILKEL